VKALIFGAGGVGLGFLSELLSSSGWEITFADIDSELVTAINKYGHITFSKVGKQIEQIQASTVSAIDLGMANASEQLTEPLATADLVFTAAGAGAFPAVGKLLASAAEAIDFSRQPLNVLCCENHKDAAAALSGATRQAMKEPALIETKFAFINTVVARMCQRLTVAECNLPPVVPGLDIVIVAEAYDLFPIDGSTAAVPVPEFKGLRILSGAEFQAWDHRKLYAHNGVHAVLGVLGKLAGHTYMYECRQDPEVDAAGRRVMWKEVGGALVRMHSQVFTRADHNAFAEDLYDRICSRLFADTVDRATRNTLRMIQAQDGRLSRAAEFVLQSGGQPRAVALGIAGVMVLNGKPQQQVAELLDYIDPSVRTELIALTEEAFATLLAWQKAPAHQLRAFLQ